MQQTAARAEAIFINRVIRVYGRRAVETNAMKPLELGFKHSSSGWQIGYCENTAAVGQLGFCFDPLLPQAGRRQRELFSEDRLLASSLPQYSRGAQIQAGGRDGGGHPVCR